MSDNHTKYFHNGRRLTFDYNADYRNSLDEVPMARVFAAAILAKQLNNNTYIKKEGNFAYVTVLDVDGSKHERHVCVNQSNREVMIGLLAYYPEIVREKVEDAEKMIASLQLDFMFKALTDDAEGYEGGLLKVIAHETVKIEEYGVIAYAPFYYENYEKELEFKERVSKSKHLGKKDEKLRLAVENVSARYIRNDNYTGWTVTAVTGDGDLVSFFTSKEELTKQDGYYAINAKVKDHQKDWKYKEFNETRLNYVSIIK
jgi:hypothetical protein